jgi:uncharacterized membrane protein YGL010W
MRTFREQLLLYGESHRDRRNCLAHLLCMPMILVSVLALLSRPNFALDGVQVSPATAAIAAVAAYYVSLQRYYGVIMTALLLLAGIFAGRLAAQSTALWLAVSITLLVLGVLLHRLGHWFERTKHSFFEAVHGVLIGPLAAVVEVALALGYDDRSREELSGFTRRD